jgi:hypothetical protein
MFILVAKNHNYISAFLRTQPRNIKTLSNHQINSENILIAVRVCVSLNYAVSAYCYSIYFQITMQSMAKLNSKL